MKPFSIYTAFPRGYCAGVHRAVGMLMEITKNYPSPIYVNHEIIHNQFVVKMFEKRGVIFEPNIENIPPESLVVISAHGTGPSYFHTLRKKNIRWIDATCPLVEKVHKEARSLIHKGYHILYIGKKGHQEAVGVIDEGKKHFTLIEYFNDLLEFKNGENGNESKGSGKLALLTQTTLSVDETDTLIEKAKELFPEIILPKVSDICYATTNRQNAIRVLCEKCDTIIVVGSKNSSNSNKLISVATSFGKKAYLVDDETELDPDWFMNTTSVGVSAGASGPEILVENVVEKLVTFGGNFEKEIRVLEEKMEFPYTLDIKQ